MTEPSAYRLKTPPHPGGFVRTEIIAPHGLSVTEAARVLGVTRAALSALLNEHAALSPEMVQPRQRTAEIHVPCADSRSPRDSDKK